MKYAFNALTGQFDLVDGPPGEVVKRANLPLSGQRVVRQMDGTYVDYCSATTSAHRETLLGITKGAAMPEASVVVQCDGEMEEPSWAWSVGNPVYCGLNGILTQSFSELWAWTRIVAIAITPTRIRIRLQDPIDNG